MLLAEQGERPVIVSMGRGGPAEPVVMPAGEAPDADGLLALARGGAHAASDYLEDAVLTGVATVGCRRCGEGPAGDMFDSNAVEGVRRAMELDPSLVVLEGSGSGIPPVQARSHGLHRRRTPDRRAWPRADGGRPPAARRSWW